VRREVSAGADWDAVLQRGMPGGGEEVEEVEGAAEIPGNEEREREAVGSESAV
jgi:hypothetical protein